MTAVNMSSKKTQMLMSISKFEENIGGKRFQQLLS